MVVETNGKPKGTAPTMNGNPNGSSTTTGSATSRSSRARRKNKSTSSSRWLADKLLKVAVWYTIITLAFRCPTSQRDLTDASPRICTPSLQVKEFVQPYVQPY